MTTGTAEPSSAAQSREEQLLTKLLEKTTTGKLVWRSQASAIMAQTPNGLRIDFILDARVFAPRQHWVSLTVRDGPAEVLSLYNGPRMMPAWAAGTPGDVLGIARDAAVMKLAGALFDAAIGRAEDDLSKALEKLDQV